jgi:hypothetical protein
MEKKTENNQPPEIPAGKVTEEEIFLRETRRTLTGTAKGIRNTDNPELKSLINAVQWTVKEIDRYLDDLMI